MSTKSPVKRNSMFGSLSVADRAKKFQHQAASTPPIIRPARSALRQKQDSQVSQPTLAPTPSPSPCSSPLLTPSPVSCSSLQAQASHKNAQESVAVIKKARRISISTPLHRRVRSDVSILDPYLGSDAATAAASNPPAIHTASFAEIDRLTAKLEANRRRSKTLANLHHGRTNSAILPCTTEENMQLRLRSSIDTIRGLNSAAPRSSVVDATSALSQHHFSFHVSPCLSEHGSDDWHRFVSSNYGAHSEVDFHVSTRVYHSKLCKADSPTLNDEATWLEEELARCSTDEDEDEDEYRSYGTVRRSAKEEYLTPDGSPLLSPVNVTAPPAVEILGLGIKDASLVLPGEDRRGHKSADSLLEQVALHETCVETLHSLSHDERQHASTFASAATSRQIGLGLPRMPNHRSSLSVPTQYPAAREVALNGNFSSTQSESSTLFGDDTYDASVSPMADMGHGDPSNDGNTDTTDERRASAASYLSNESTASADISNTSHGSSLLFNAHLATPAMARGGSADTANSTCPSSAASSFCHENASVKPPRSPLRMSAMPLPPLPKEASIKSRCSKESTRLLRQASRRKEGTQQPQPPTRLDNLDATVGAAPKEMQLKEEFPERLLGDWMADQHAGVVDKQQHGDEHSVSVEPVPLHMRIHKKDGTTCLPGLGEIVPASPDVATNMALSPHDVPAYPSAPKRLGTEPLQSTCVLKGEDSASVAGDSGMGRSTKLKSKLSGRLGLSSKEGACDAGANKMGRKISESSLPNMLERMRKSPGKPESGRARGGKAAFQAALQAAAELPAAWKDRIVVQRPSLDTRRPSMASSISTSTQTSSPSSSIGAQRATLLAVQMSRDESRTRSSMSFRKMLSSITGVEHATVIAESTDSVQVTLQELAASTFESPKSAHRSSIRRATACQRYESFMEFSDEEHEESISTISSTGSSIPSQNFDSTSTTPTPTPTLTPTPTITGRKGTGRKDLTKMFGASHTDLSQPKLAEEPAPATALESGWTASFGRSNSKKRAGR